ncbi:hypothetical protein WR25_17890 [Diploscapter pachys]|uniref:G-protein coupled receptors family 3 profile domain-containing protein n=1 Tax=Diploscapter pachys TaxID=2018661 RepID=A0A2A2KTR1_9BILA|nr:hypothetical protein WR25_17890 [Diploscapter pachys]
MKCLHLRSHSMFSVLVVATQVFVSVNLVAKTADAQNLTPQEKGALILDSCSDPSYALNQSFEFVKDMIGSSDASSYVCEDNDPQQMNRDRKNVAAVVGEIYSSISVQLANLLQLFRISQVSPGSTSSSLSDKSQFPFFARTAPSDYYQAKAMADIAAKFGWTYVSLVYSADEYGQLGADAFKNEAQKKGICIAAEERIHNKQENFIESIDNLVEKLQPEDSVGARVVILFVSTDYVLQLLHYTTERMNLTTNSEYNEKKLIWVASDGWDLNNAKYTEGVNQLAAEGAIVLALSSQKVPDFNEYFLNLHPGSDKFERNQWLRELWQGKFKCEFGAPPESSVNRCEDIRQSSEGFNANDKVLYVIDAVYAIAHALQAYTSTVCANDTTQSNWFSQPNPVPVTGSTVKPDSGASPASNYIEIGYWSENNLIINEKALWWAGEATPISICSEPCPVGYRKQNIKNEQCCWACIQCEDFEYLVNEASCVPCDMGWCPTEDRTSCYDMSRKNLEYMQWSSMYSIVPAIIAAIGIVLTLFTIAIFILNNETPVVKASCRELSYILLVSMMMCYLMTFVLLSKPNVFVCAMKRADSRYDYPRRDQVVLTCNVPDHHFLYSLAYDALLIILCTIYAVKTRKVGFFFKNEMIDLC